MASGTTYLTSDKTRLLTPHYFRGGNLPKVMQSTNTSNATFLTVNTPTGTFGFYVNANSSWAGLASQYGTNAVEYFAYFEINPEATYSRIQFQKKTLFKENVSISKELTVDNSIFTHNGIYMYGSSTSNVTDSLYFTKTADAGGATLTNSGTEYSYPTGPNIFPVRIYGYPARWKITYTDGVEKEKTIYDSPSLWINIKSVKSSDLTATGYNEYYYLSSTNDRTNSGNYRIHSTKYLITVGQGGTGSNTSAFQSGGIIYYNGSNMVSNANLTTSGSNITIKATYYPLIYLEALSTNGASTYTRGYLEAGYDDKLVLWCDSDKTTTSKSRRGLAVYGYANKSDSKYALALRQCDTTGAWQADQYILTNGNWNNWITLSAIGAAASSHSHSSSSLTDIALTWSGSYSTGDWMLIHNGETGANGGQLFRAINAANTAAWVDGAHKWVRLAGDTMTGNLTLPAGGRLGKASGNLFIGASDNSGWVLTQDICSHAGAGDTYWSLRVTGVAHFKTAYGAVWNDYAEMRNVPKAQIDIHRIYDDKGEIERNYPYAGHCVHEIGDGTMELTNARLAKGCKIISDTFGFCIGETEDCCTPIAVTGRVLAFPYENIEEYKNHIGECVCSGPNGTISIMTSEEIIQHPECIVGTISEIPTYAIWRCGNKDTKPIKVNGRIWIYVR